MITKSKVWIKVLLVYSTRKTKYNVRIQIGLIPVVLGPGQVRDFFVTLIHRVGETRGDDNPSCGAQAESFGSFWSMERDKFLRKVIQEQKP